VIDYAPLTERQASYIRNSLGCWLNVLEGGKRSGKNIINLIAWAMALEIHPDRLHLAAGSTLANAKLNIIDSNGFGLRFIFEGRCREGKYQDRDALYIKTKTGDKIVLISGGPDVRSAAKIKGNSYGTVYVTEVNECDPDFVKEVFDRTLTSSERKLFFDLNPKPPAHWFYNEVLDFFMKKYESGEIPDFNYAHFTLESNLSISDDALRKLLGTYDRDSIWYQRDILGLRTSASGRIYTSYKHADVSVTRDELRDMRFVELAVGVDVGGTAATVATLTGFTAGYQTVCHIDGLFSEQGIEDKMDEASYAREIVEWLIPWSKIYPALGKIYVDSANKLFQRALKKELDRRGLTRFVVRPFNKKDGILSRIELSCMLLSQGRYKIAEHMKEWHEAYQMAVWDAEEYADGEWVRVDNGSYPVDCLDSAEYSVYPFERNIINAYSDAEISERRTPYRIGANSL
jgi:Terminase-like family.